MAAFGTGFDDSKIYIGIPIDFDRIRSPVFTKTRLPDILDLMAVSSAKDDQKMPIDQKVHTKITPQFYGYWISEGATCKEKDGMRFSNGYRDTYEAHCKIINANNHASTWEIYEECAGDDLVPVSHNYWWLQIVGNQMSAQVSNEGGPFDAPRKLSRCAG